MTLERGRLAKEREREQKEIGQIDNKLGNLDFLRRAPEEVVEEIRERRELAVDRLGKIEVALQRIETALSHKKTT